MKLSLHSKGFLLIVAVIVIVIIGAGVYFLFPPAHLIPSLPTNTSSSTQPENSPTFILPTNGVLLGIHAGPESNTTGEAGITSLQTAIGRPLAIDSDYVDWNPSSHPYGFPNTARIEWDQQHGLITMESWRTDFAAADPSGGCATAADIIGGKYDTQIAQEADAAKKLGVTILVRWHYEMTDNDDDVCFNNGQSVKKNFAVAGPNFVNSWKHIVDIFRKEGATNVQWVWSPAAGLFSGENGKLDATDWKLFYPGNDYVDWIADDHYNKTNTPESFATDPDIANFYSQVSGLGKPLMQSETGANSDPNQNPDPQTEWITTVHSALATKYPDFKAFIYWNGKDGGYGLVGPGLAAYKQMASDPHFTALPFSK